MSGPLDYVATNLVAPKGTQACADDLDALLVPLDATKRTAADTLRAAGLGRRNDVVTAALRWRRTKAGDHSGTTLHDDPPGPDPGPPGATTPRPAA
jgi:hypothetical protein